MRRVAFATLLLAGCAQVFGIESTTAGQDAAPPDTASLTFTRLSIGNTLVLAPQDLTGYTASFDVADPSDPTGLRSVAATQSAMDTWSADLPDPDPEIRYTLPDYPMALTRVWQFGRNLHGLYGWLEHPDPTPAPDTAMMTFSIALPSGYSTGESIQVMTLGSWTNRVLAAAELPAPDLGLTQVSTTYPFSSVSSISGRPLEAITHDDELVVLRYLGNDLTGAFVAPPFDQTGTDTIQGTMTAVPNDQTLDVTIQPDAVDPRYQQVRPAVASLGMAWYLHASPGYLYANTNGPLLNAVGVAPTDPGALTAAYGNPFTNLGWKTVMTWSTNERRTYTPAGSMIGATLYAGMYEVAEPTAGSTLDLPAGLPVTVKIDQMPLLVDGVTLTLDPAKAVDLSFDVEAGHLDNTFYQVNLYELVPNDANTALQYEVRLGCSGLAPHFVVPRSLFSPGHLYTLRAISVKGGYPALASGDLTNRDLPESVSYLDSGVFEIAP